MARKKHNNSEKLKMFLTTPGVWELLVVEARKRLQKEGLLEKFKSGESLANEAAWSLFRRVDESGNRYAELSTAEEFVKVLCKFMTNKAMGAREYWSQQRRDRNRVKPSTDEEPRLAIADLAHVNVESIAELKLIFEEVKERVLRDIEKLGCKPEIKDRVKDVFLLKFVFSVSSQEQVIQLLGDSRGQVQRAEGILISIFRDIEKEHAEPNEGGTG